MIEYHNTEIITDLNKLNKQCDNVSLQDAKETSNKLIEVLKDLEKNNICVYGISANQIGINKRVCVFKTTNDEYITLVNPKICTESGSICVTEGCLSFPNNKDVRTKRSVYIEVMSDNYPGKLLFGPDDDKLDIHNLTNEQSKLLTESIIVQHEIDHTNGLTILDREEKYEQFKSSKIGRNEYVRIKNNDTGELKLIKYKKAENYLKNNWFLI